MKSIAWGVGLSVALLGAATGIEGAQAIDDGAAILTAADTTAATPRPLDLLQPGVPVRASFALCGDTRRPVTELTGTFVALMEEGFEMKVATGDRELLHQVALTDLLSIQVGTERNLTKKGTMIGAVSGVALGVASAMIGASGTSGDPEYATGAVIGGLFGAGVGRLLGSRSTTMEWQELPLYGPAYGD
jgi:hypothetical protein